ncbi:MAG: hypothetical protein FGM32_04340 [Candidatus Kapabacteria bacterium]|nr:hypothetical protein [Candidatus Kapabacteria bacterium]
MYEPLYGRFLSTDPLWSKYLPLQPYQYAGNQPISLLDDGGKWVQAVDAKAQEAVRNSVPEKFRDFVVFNDGILDVGRIKEGAQGQDVNSNISVLSRLAENDNTIDVAVSDEVTALDKSGDRISAHFSDFDRPGERINGLTLAPRSDQKSSGLSDGVPFSTTGNIQVVIRASGESKQSKGVTAAHELFAHARFILLCRVGKAASARESDPAVQKAIKRAEREAQSP